MVAFLLKWLDYHAYITLLTAKNEEAVLKDFKKKLEERARDGLTDCRVPDDYEHVIIPWAEKEGFKVVRGACGYFVEWGKGAEDDEGKSEEEK